ncbi:MAG: hypothetical protein NY202_02580 [Mollicutes bacterium UO1]
MEQIQTELNKIFELEKRPTPEQLRETAESLEGARLEIKTLEAEKTKAIKEKALALADKKGIEKSLKETRENLTKENIQLQQQIIDLQQQLDNTLDNNKEPEPAFFGLEKETDEGRMRIQTELDRFSQIEKIEEITDEEVEDFLSNFKEMKN